jgi:hypothetical protein
MFSWRDNPLPICFGEVNYSTSWRRRSMFSGNLSSMSESSDTPAGRHTDTVPDAAIPQIHGVHSPGHSNNQRDDPVVHKDHDSSRIVCCCSLLKSDIKTPHHLSHQFDTLFGFL